MCALSIFIMSRVAKRFYRVDSLHGLDNLDRGESASTENRWVFEISHEAANKGRLPLSFPREITFKFGDELFVWQ